MTDRYGLLPFLRAGTSGADSAVVVFGFLRGDLAAANQRPGKSLPQPWREWEVWLGN